MVRQKTGDKLEDLKNDYRSAYLTYIKRREAAAALLAKADESDDKVSFAELQRSDKFLEQSEKEVERLKKKLVATKKVGVDAIEQAVQLQYERNKKWYPRKQKIKTVEQLIEDFKDKHARVFVLDKLIDSCENCISRNSWFAEDLKKHKRKYKAAERHDIFHNLRTARHDLRDYQEKREKVYPKLEPARLKLQEHLIDVDPIEAAEKTECEIKFKELEEKKEQIRLLNPWG